MAKKKSMKQKDSEHLSGFQGSIELAPYDVLINVAGLKGASQVWFPKTKADVEVAVIKSKNQRTFVRSGLQASAANAPDVTGGIVINLDALKKVAIRKRVLNAEAAATTGSVAEHLVRHGLALPLFDNPLKSIASNVLGDEPSCLMRTLGPLSNFVTKISGVNPAGKSMLRSGTSAIKQVKDDNAVVTGITFNAASADTLWMFRKTFPYPGRDLFATLVKTVFMNSRVPSRTDIVLDAFSSRYDIPLIRITAAGTLEADEEIVASLIENAMSGFPPELSPAIVTKKYAGTHVIRSILDAGAVIPTDPEVETHRIRHTLGKGMNPDKFIDDMLEDVDRGLAFREDGAGKKDKQLRVFIRLQLDREDRLMLSGYLYTPRQVTPMLPVRLASGTVWTRIEEPLHAGVEMDSIVAPRIPGFSGDVNIPSDFLYGIDIAPPIVESFGGGDLKPTPP